MNEFNKWVANKEDADFLYGGETIEISEADIQKLRAGWLYNFSVNDEYGCVLQYKNFPAKWYKNNHTFWTCNKCNFVNDFNRIEYSFCPNCGAYMKGGAE